MPYVAVILWIVVWLFRFLLDGDTTGRGVQVITATGRVEGHAGPGMRSFSGRAGRREWWVILAWSSLVGGMLTRIPHLGPLLATPWIIAIFAVASRRLHDLGLSARILIFVIAVCATVVASYAAWTWALPRFRGGISDWWAFSEYSTLGLAFVGVALTLWLGIFRGANGPNVYGEADEQWV